MSKRSMVHQGSSSSKSARLGEVIQENPIIIEEKYADPTLDMTFKMLFGNSEHKDVLISLLNSLLEFNGAKEIIEVEIASPELHLSHVSDKKGKAGIACSVDILCINKGRQKMAIEIQGQKTKYFLAREQVYMSSLIVGQAKEGDGRLYHEAVLKTYIIIIAKANIFIGDTGLKNSSLFELDVQPFVLQTQELVPGNKMFWKFFELAKFQRSINYQSINEYSPIKEQWLEFLIDCSKQQSEPNRHEIIKKGYKIMEVAKWTPDQQALYMQQKQHETEARLAQEALEREVREAREEAREAFEKGEMKGKLEGKLEGKIEGEIKGEISKVKSLLKYNVPQESIVQDLKFLTDPRLLENLDNNLDYIRKHNDETDSLICENLGLVGVLSGEGDGM